MLGGFSKNVKDIFVSTLDNTNEECLFGEEGPRNI
jgi:hypothetical protein